MAVSFIEHACRVKADEEGIEAAAYTVSAMAGGVPQYKGEFKVDRPFMFLIKGYDNSLYFCGIVNQL